mmetsp:Transcript_5818/g.8729  ORF Transcript_5818/g.8729 Transcript_5818/m.8729 type:complete len:172 (+) Transcript_5818:25-540(+)
MNPNIFFLLPCLLIVSTYTRLQTYFGNSIVDTSSGEVSTESTSTATWDGEVKKTMMEKKGKGEAPTPSLTTPEKVFALNVKLVVKEERRDDFLSTITYDQKQTLLLEPGAIAFVVGADFYDSNTFYLHEEYKSLADFQYHMSTEHYAKWDAFCKEEPFVSQVNDAYFVLPN